MIPRSFCSQDGPVGFSKERRQTKECSSSMAEQQTIEQERHEYELVVVIQPDMDEQGVANINERLSQIITGQAGAIDSTEMWGKRTLAYPIRKYFEGHYILHRFQMNPSGAEEIDRLLRFNENVIRYLVIRTDE
jgi:small subunit ribosomal protein S6